MSIRLVLVEMKNNDIININIYKVSCTQVSRFKGVGKEFNRIIMTNATQTWNSILPFSKDIERIVLPAIEKES